MSAGIYAIINVMDGKRYVGQSHDLSGRLGAHRSDLRRRKHRNRHLQHAWDKYGESAFEFCVVDTDVDVSSGKSEQSRLALILAEQFWMDTLGRHHGMLYNHVQTAGTMLGYKHSVETRAKWSALQKMRTERIRVGQRLQRVRYAAAGLDFNGKQPWTARQRKSYDSHLRHVVKHRACASALCQLLNDEREAHAPASVVQPWNRRGVYRTSAFEHDCVLTALSPMEQDILLARLRGRSYTEIGAVLSISAKSTDNAIARANRKIRAYIKRKEQQK